MQAFGPDAEETQVTRSFLFVPGDSERKLEKALDVGADAFIVDLEDSVAAAARPAARQMTAEFLAGKDNVWVRINPLDSADAIADLEAVLSAAPAGIVLPKARNGDDIVNLSETIDAAEREFGLARDAIKIMPLVTERPESMFALGSYAGRSTRMTAMSWGAEDLSAAVGASRNRDDDGNWLPTYEMARSLCLLAAAAAEVAALDTVYTDFRNTEGLARYAANARRDGFSGMLAIHPAQVEVINDAFRPSPQEIRQAERIVELFDANPGAGAVGLDGKMIDRPHHLQALRILQLAKRQ
ncbi:MAG: CoA ester lyase [Woeseiaceae bacterium]